MRSATMTGEDQPSPFVGDFQTTFFWVESTSAHSIGRLGLFAIVPFWFGPRNSGQSPRAVWGWDACPIASRLRKENSLELRLGFRRCGFKVHSWGLWKQDGSVGCEAWVNQERREVKREDNMLRSKRVSGLGVVGLSVCFGVSLTHFCSLGDGLVFANGSANGAVVKQESLKRVTEGDVKLVSDGYKFTEGPSVDGEGNVFFTDQPNDRIVKISVDGSVSDFLKPAGRSNGMYFAPDGKLIACADEANELWELDREGKHRVLLKEFQGVRLNGPNDVWLDSNGTIYFTDPYYQRPWWEHKKQPQAKQSVYKVDRNGENLVCVDDALVQPNGIIGDAKKRLLYVADIGDRKTYRYTIGRDGELLDRSVFCQQGSDGMTLDSEGNVYLTGSAGVYVYNPEGELIETIKVPKGWSANVCLGGADRKTLFITASDSVFSVRVRNAGIGSK